MKERNIGFFSEKLSKKIDANLLNAKNIIQVSLLEGTDKLNFIKHSLEVFKRLDTSYPTITNEEKLVLLALCLNLVIHTFEIKAVQDNKYYISKLKTYFKNLGKEYFLSVKQKTKWSAAIGNIYQLIEQYPAAIDCYEKAIAFKTTSPIVKNYMLAILELTLRYAVQSENISSNVPAAKKAYDQVVKKADEALKLSGNQLNHRIYYLKAEALGRLAVLQDEKIQSIKAIELLLDALLADTACLQYATSPNDRNKHLKHMTICVQVLLKLSSTTASKKLPIADFKSKIENLENLINTFDPSTLNELGQAVKELHNCISASASPKEAITPNSVEHKLEMPEFKN